MCNEARECPEVEILLATYNGERYLAELLDSIIKQTYKNWRITVSDDGSTDATRTILEKYASNEPRITLLPKTSPHGSACANFMYLLEQSTAYYVMFCDQDDVWLPSKIEDEMGEMRDSEAVNKEVPILIGTDLQVVGEQLEAIDTSFWHYQKMNDNNIDINHLLCRNIVPGCTMLINRPLVNLAVLPDTSGIVMHDWWIAIIASALGEIRLIKRPLALYRQHGNNAVGAEEYSIQRKVKNYKGVVVSVRNSVAQTRTFADRFETLCDEKTAESVRRYGSISKECGLVKNVANYLKSKVRQGGFVREIGQLSAIAYLTGSKLSTGSES